MKKTIVKIEYTEDPFTIKEYHAYFYGYRAGEISMKWKFVEKDRYDYYNSLYLERLRQISKMRSEANNIYRQVEEARRFHRFWYNKTEKEMLSNADEISKRVCELEEEQKTFQDKSYFKDYEKRWEMEKFLIKNGFVPVSKTSCGVNPDIKKEVWVLQE